jgi:hypothetical protein
MTEILVFSVARRAAQSRAGLTRVWFETGNPSQPLACKWIAAKTDSSKGASKPANGRLCA